MVQDIDFVITWVDNADIEWQKEFKKYKQQVCDTKNVGVQRYRDWSFLKYWFRAVEVYAPWVRKIHFVTFGHYPKWLNELNPKLNIVNHKDFIPEQALPTFSSRAIEFNLHKISGLSERFVLFNDDMFIGKPIEPSDFFKNGLPCDFAISNALSGGDVTNAIMNNLAVINRNFVKYEVIKKHFIKFFNMKYGWNQLRTVLLLAWPNFTGFIDPHQPQPYLKKTFDTLWEMEEKVLMDTVMQRFRSGDGCNPYLFRYWQLVKGCFLPSKNEGVYLELNLENLSGVQTEFASGKNKTICLNDVDGIENFERVKSELLNILEKQFPKKSSYEL